MLLVLELFKLWELGLVIIFNTLGVVDLGLISFTFIKPAEIIEVLTIELSHISDDSFEDYICSIHF
jgi:hypothetical protein